MCRRDVLQVLQFNGWPTLFLDISTSQLALRPQQPLLPSVITKVKNPLRAYSQCGRTHQNALRHTAVFCLSEVDMEAGCIQYCIFCLARETSSENDFKL